MFSMNLKKNLEFIEMENDKNRVDKECFNKLKFIVQKNDRNTIFKNNYKKIKEMLPFLNKLDKFVVNLTFLYPKKIGRNKKILKEKEKNFKYLDLKKKNFLKMENFYKYNFNCKYLTREKKSLLSIENKSKNEAQIKIKKINYISKLKNKNLEKKIIQNYQKNLEKKNTNISSQILQNNNYLIKNLNYFWRGTNKYYPSIFKKSNKINNSEFEKKIKSIESIDLSCKVVKNQ